MDQKAMFRLSYGLFVLTAKSGEKDNGCIINTVTQVTSNPNRITVAVNKQNLTHDMIVETGNFNVSILTEEAAFTTFQHFGFQSGRDVDKMQGIEYERSDNEVVYLTKETNAFLSGKVISMTDLGTHTLFLADVTAGEILSDVESVTYSYYQKHIKPAPEKQDNPPKGYVCTICGYVYEGDPLPDDFICPLCKHPASDFKKL